MRYLFIPAVIFFIIVSPKGQNQSAYSQQSPPVQICPHPEGGATDQGQPISGRVIETINISGYTYIYLERTAGNIWVVVPEMKIVKGKNMSFEPGNAVFNFESRAFMIRFDKIVFSPGPVLRGRGKAGKPASGNVKITSTTQKTRVEKAGGFNAYTIAEIYQKKKILDGRDIMVRGRVVKVSSGIMNRNWIHLQDGSGGPKRGGHTLVVTSSDLPSLGDILTANGVIHRDRDFGAGYKYSVIVEDADIYPF